MKQTFPTNYSSNYQQAARAPPQQSQMSNQPRYHMVPGGDAGSRMGPRPPLSPSNGSASQHSADSIRMRTQSPEDGSQDLGPYSHIRKGSARGMQNGYNRQSQGQYSYAPSSTHSTRNGPYNTNVVNSGAASTSDRSGSTKFNSGGSQSERKLLFDSAGPPQTTYLLSGGKEDLDPDDYLHNPDGRKRDTRFILCSPRGFLNVLVLVILICGLLTLFAGYPIISHFTGHKAGNLGGFNIGGTNGTGQVPQVVPQIRLIDLETPQNSRTWTSPQSNQQYHLVFSDEFNTEGRTFWPNDDPFWEAVNIWYGATGDYEWYTPEQINTTGGHLQITLTDQPIHNLNFRSGMLQSWNKFCFQGGYIEFAAILPGSPTQIGWWPGLWLMGNLARPGYLGTTDGMWPYSYNACDSGILINQTAPGRTGYNEVSTYASTKSRTGLNWLNGMRTPGCTCSGESHPGPNNNVGRSAPELDILEAQIKGQSQGQASQSVQVAPFDLGYDWDTDASTIFSNSRTSYNTYKGGVYQEAGSALTSIPATSYALTGNTYHTFGVDYTPDFTLSGKGTVTWYMDGVATWTVSDAAFPARPDIDISQRFIPLEPMSIVMNLGLSRGFQSDLDFDTLTYPATMKVDYVRVYQSDANKQDLVSCDPPNYPTSKYIQDNLEVYMNPNHTTFPGKWPKNKITGC